MLFAFASTPLELLTTVQVAEMRNEPEITWRKRAEGGKIPGAFKVGNRWLMECRVLHAMGVIENVVNINDEVNINTEEQIQALADVLGVSIDGLLGINEDTIQIPESLRQFAEHEHLKPTDVRMLARINYRGEQPDTVAKWQLLYLAIRTTTKY